MVTGHLDVDDLAFDAGHDCVDALTSMPTYSVDFSMGAWSPSHAAYEISQQLGQPLPSPKYEPQANVINLSVDREARGDGVLVTAHAHALWLAQHLPHGACVSLVRPLYGLPMRRENRAFLRYLHGFGIRIISVPRTGDLSEELPQLLQIFPGLIMPDVIAELRVRSDHPALSVTPSGRFRVHPCARKINPRALPMIVDRLAYFEKFDSRLFAFCQHLGSSLFVDAERLAKYAGDVVQSTDDLALDLAARARCCARTPVQMAITELQLQGIRIFLHKFVEVASTGEPARQLPEPLRRELHAMRGWGKVMTGEITEARRCFALSGEEGEDTACLYRRNIAALACYRDGDLAGARRIEEEIATALADQPDPDPQLSFVNALNIGRLCRAAGDQTGYRESLSRAFATTDNVRSLSEALQLNFLQSEALRETEPQAAAFCDLRAAMAWLAMEPPEALSIRAKRTVLTRTVPMRRLDAEISAVLDERLATDWPDITPLELADLPHVQAAGPGEDLPPSAMAGADGVFLAWSASRRPRLQRGVGALALANRAFAIFLAETHTDIGVSSGTWLIDGATACDVRAAHDDSIASAWRHGLQFNSPRGTSLYLTLGPAVRALHWSEDSVTAHFKRHLPPTRITGKGHELLRLIECNRRVDTDTLIADMQPVARMLVEERLVGVSTDVA